MNLSEWVAVRYDLPRPVECRLLRAYTNDVYAVVSAGNPFVLKIYGAGWRTESEIRYEIALLRHLSARGLPVAAPVGSADIAATDDLRWTALFGCAPGDKPQPPFTPRLYHAFGRAIARMHALSDDFVTEHRRASLDLPHLIDEPLALAAPLWGEPEDREFLTELAKRVKAAIAALAAENLDWGPIHGDATLDNLHVTADGEVVLFDFDSGGPGWRAMDLQGWAVGNAEYAPKWEAFRQGYSEIRPLKAVDLRAAPWLTIASDIYGIRIDLDNRILRQGRERTESYLREQAALLRARARSLLSME